MPSQFVILPLLIGVLIVGGCQAPTTPAKQTSVTSEPSSTPFVGWRLIDLSHTLKADIPLYPEARPFELHTLVTLEQGYYINEFSMGEHVGTHVDAPSHFARGGHNVDELPLDTLVGPIAVLDLRAQAAAEPDLGIGVAHLEAWESRHGRLPENCFLLANTGWWERWSNPAAYVNLGEDGVMRFPGFSPSLMSFLLENRRVRGVGIDTLSTDTGSSTTFEQHRILLGAGMVNLENLTNLSALPATGAYLLVAPLKIGNGSGAPARVIALVPSPSAPD